MGEMTAVGEVHRKNLVAGFNCGEINRHVRLGATVRLNVHMLCAKQSLCTINGELLGHIDILATTVPAFSRITLRVLVCKDAALGFHDRAAREIFRGDQLDVFALPFLFGSDGSKNFRIHLAQVAAESSG